MTYSQKLRDPRWQKKRLEILQRDNWTCQACQSTTKNLQVHHLVYRKIDPWDYDDECYQTLCEDCHEIRQALTDKIVDGMRLGLKSVPTPELEKRLNGENGTTEDSGSDFDGFVVSSLQEAQFLSSNGKGTIEDPLWSDAVMGLIGIQLFKNTASVCRRTKHLLEMVLEKISPICSVNGEEAE